MDISLFYFINHGLQNRFFDFLMPIISEESYFRLPLLVAWVCLIIWGGRKGRMVALLSLLLFFFSDEVGYLLKMLIRRPRPCQVLPGVHLLQGCSRSYSFPSNHATNVFAIGTYLSYFYRWLLLPALIVCMGVGISRVYVGVHYPSDVGGGAMVGLLCAALLILLHRAISLSLDRRRKGSNLEHG